MCLEDSCMIVIKLTLYIILSFFSQTVAELEV